MATEAKAATYWKAQNVSYFPRTLSNRLQLHIATEPRSGLHTIRDV